MNENIDLKRNAILVVNSEGTILKMNRYVEEFFGVDPLDYNFIDQICPLFASQASSESPLKSKVMGILLKKNQRVLPIQFGKIHHFAAYQLTPMTVAKDCNYLISLYPINRPSSWTYYPERDLAQLEELIPALPQNYEFRFSLPLNKDYEALNTTKKIVTPLFVALGEFLIQEAENPDAINYFLNFMLEPSNLVIQRLSSIFQHFHRPLVCLTNLLLLRILFPPLFALQEEGESKETFKGILKRVYDRITGKNLSAEAMKDSPNLEVLFNTLFGTIIAKSRTYRLKTYSNCFVASDVIDWIYDNMGFSTREEALNLAIQLQQAGYMEHTVDKKKPFQDKFLFFRWTKSPGNTPLISAKQPNNNLTGIKEILVSKEETNEMRKQPPNEQNKQSNEQNKQQSDEQNKRQSDEQNKQQSDEQNKQQSDEQNKQQPDEQNKQQSNEQNKQQSNEQNKQQSNEQNKQQPNEQNTQQSDEQNKKNLAHTLSIPQHIIETLKDSKVLKVLSVTTQDCSSISVPSNQTNILTTLEMCLTEAKQQHSSTGEEDRVFIILESGDTLVFFSASHAFVKVV